MFDSNGVPVVESSERGESVLVEDGTGHVVPVIPSAGSSSNGKPKTERLSTRENPDEHLSTKSSRAGTPRTPEQIVEWLENDVHKELKSGTLSFIKRGEMVKRGLAEVGRSVPEKNALEARQKWIATVSERIGRFVPKSMVSKWRKVHALSVLCDEIKAMPLSVVQVLMTLAKITSAGDAAWQGSAGSKGRKFAANECLQFVRKACKEKWSLAKAKTEIDMFRKGKETDAMKAAAKATQRAAALKRIADALGKLNTKNLAKWVNDPANVDLANKIKAALK
mgnify:CR=1 FL=1